MLNVVKVVVPSLFSIQNSTYLTFDTWAECDEVASFEINVSTLRRYFIWFLSFLLCVWFSSTFSLYTSALRFNLAQFSTKKLRKFLIIRLKIGKLKQRFCLFFPRFLSCYRQKNGQFQWNWLGIMAGATRKQNLNHISNMYDVKRFSHVKCIDRFHFDWPIRSFWKSKYTSEISFSFLRSL